MELLSLTGHFHNPLIQVNCGPGPRQVLDAAFALEEGTSSALFRLKADNKSFFSLPWEHLAAISFGTDNANWLLLFVHFPNGEDFTLQYCHVHSTFIL